MITHSLVELQGGWMQVESQPGKKRLLVVEDRETTPLFQHLLERHGYEVLITCSGQEVLLHAWLEQPDLITLDLHVADSTGFTVFEHLKTNPQTAEIPILLEG